MRRVVDGRLESEAIRANAERFSREVFRNRFIASVADAQGTPS